MACLKWQPNPSVLTTGRRYSVAMPRVCYPALSVVFAHVLSVFIRAKLMSGRLNSRSNFIYLRTGRAALGMYFRLKVHIVSPRSMDRNLCETVSTKVQAISRDHKPKGNYCKLLLKVSPKLTWLIRWVAVGWVQNFTFQYYVHI